MVPERGGMGHTRQRSAPARDFAAAHTNETNGVSSAKSQGVWHGTDGVVVATTSSLDDALPPPPPGSVSATSSPKQGAAWRLGKRLSRLTTNHSNHGSPKSSPPPPALTSSTSSQGAVASPGELFNDYNYTHSHVRTPPRRNHDATKKSPQRIFEPKKPLTLPDVDTDDDDDQNSMAGGGGGSSVVSHFTSMSEDTVKASNLDINSNIISTPAPQKRFSAIPHKELEGATTNTNPTPKLQPREGDLPPLTGKKKKNIVQKTTRKIRKKIMNMTPHNKGSTPAVPAQNQLAWQNVPPRQGQSQPQPQRNEVNDDSKSGLALRHSPMAPRRYFPDSDAASSASNHHGVVARKRMQSDGPNYKSPTSVSGVIPNRTSLDDAIRGRLDGMDCLALGSARVSSLQKEGMVQYTCRKMVSDMLRNSGGPPELIMEGFLPHGEDRWMVRIDEPHVTSPATCPIAKTEANEASETASSSNSSSASTKESTSDVKKVKESETDTDSEDGEQARQRALTHDSGPDLERAALAAATSVTSAEVASPPSPSRSIPGKMKREEEGNESIDASNCVQSAVSLMEQMWGKENSPPISHMSRRRLLDQQENDVDGNSDTDGVVNQNDILDLAAACSVPIDIDEDLFIIEDARHLQAVHDLAAVPLKQGRYDEALEIFDKILRSLQNRSNGKPHYLLGSAMHNIGIINMWAGTYEEGLSSLYDAVRVRVDALPEDHPDVAVSLAKTGMILFSLERFEDALSSFEQALQMIHIDNATRAKLLNNIGATYYQMSNFVESLKYFTTALEIQRMWLEGPVRRESSVFDASVTLGNMGKLQTSCFKKDQRIVLTTLGNLAFAKTQKGDKAQALQIYQGIYRSQEAKLGANSREAVETMGLMSVIHIQQCNYDEALTCLTAVLKWQQKTLDASHPAVQNTMETIEKIEQTLKGEVSVWI
eukprot:scaffold7251_cov43-Attheya_sp.AAC.4